MRIDSINRVECIIEVNEKEYHIVHNYHIWTMMEEVYSYIKKYGSFCIAADKVSDEYHLSPFVEKDISSLKEDSVFTNGDSCVFLYGKLGEEILIEEDGAQFLFEDGIICEDFLREFGDAVINSIDNIVVEKTASFADFSDDGIEDEGELDIESDEKIFIKNTAHLLSSI